MVRKNKMNARILLLLVLIVNVPYFWNIYMLTRCDFEAPYKCEVIHGGGIILPPAAFVTMWFSGDAE